MMKTGYQAKARYGKQGTNEQTLSEEKNAKCGVFFTLSHQTRDISLLFVGILEACLKLNIFFCNIFVVCIFVYIK